jgi:hypothetical protein
MEDYPVPGKLEASLHRGEEQRRSGLLLKMQGRREFWYWILLRMKLQGWSSVPCGLKLNIYY